MQLAIKSNINIESDNFIETMLMLNNQTIRPSYFASFDPRSPFLNIDQNPAPLVFLPTPSIVNERIDDIPLLTAIFLKLNLPNIVDKFYTPHANHEGLSHGWLLTVWLVYI